MRSLLIIHNESTATERRTERSARKLLPEYILQSEGYQVRHTNKEEQAREWLMESEAAILHVPIADINRIAPKLLERKTVPLVWWCSSLTMSQSLESCEDDVRIDGVLTPSMSGSEIHWVLHFSTKQCFERKQWADEKQMLLSKLEERKWIDMAKGILCEIKNISEAEAYELLRKQAMNERKRMVDVATSIVKVYQLLQSQK
ncbi:ANTAR domain-containing response regulator [Paenibacillus thailandensis]|uniref:ANTAR domain-containing response regulator n=1 Tax=Paenibacillus thailandensis TaxID=393250 RepID=A0ABW5R5S0_9BACL